MAGSMDMDTLTKSNRKRKSLRIESDCTEDMECKQSDVSTIVDVSR